MAAIETKIPLFPLPMLLLPGERRVLHIFEARYIQLIQDLDHEFPVFGIPHFSENKTESEVIYGSLVKLVEVVKHYPEGESDIVIEAFDLFELRSFEMKQSGKEYPGGLVRILKDYKSWEMSSKVIEHFRELVRQTDESEDFNPEEIGLFDILLSLGVNDNERVKFLNLNSRKVQEAKLIAQLKFTSLVRAQEKKKEYSFYMN